MTPTPSTDKTVAEAMERAAFEAWYAQWFAAAQVVGFKDNAWAAWQARAAAPAESAAMPEGQPDEDDQYRIVDSVECTCGVAHAKYADGVWGTVGVASPAESAAIDAAVKTKGKDDSPSGGVAWCSACGEGVVPGLCRAKVKCGAAAPQTAAPAAEPEPVGWFDSKELAELKHANGMDIWAESHSIWGPGMRADPAVHASHLVPLFTAAPPTAAQSDEALIAAAQAVVDRWETPLWKDAEPTAVFINRLRAALQQKG